MCVQCLRKHVVSFRGHVRTSHTSVWHLIHFRVIRHNRLAIYRKTSQFCVFLSTHAGNFLLCCETRTERSRLAFEIRGYRSQHLWHQSEICLSTIILIAKENKTGYNSTSESRWFWREMNLHCKFAGNSVLTDRYFASICDSTVCVRYHIFAPASR